MKINATRGNWETYYIHRKQLETLEIGDEVIMQSNGGLTFAKMRVIEKNDFSGGYRAEKTRVDLPTAEEQIYKEQFRGQFVPAATVADKILSLERKFDSLLARLQKVEKEVLEEDPRF